jgi:hypothetical protein
MSRGVLQTLLARIIDSKQLSMPTRMVPHNY